MRNCFLVVSMLLCVLCQSAKADSSPWYGSGQMFNHSDHPVVIWRDLPGNTYVFQVLPPNTMTQPGEEWDYMLDIKYLPTRWHKNWATYSHVYNHGGSVPVFKTGVLALDLQVDDYGVLPGNPLWTPHDLPLPSEITVYPGIIIDPSLPTFPPTLPIAVTPGSTTIPRIPQISP